MSNATDATVPTSAKEDLAKRLAHRPDREDLVGRNILPNSNVAPALMAAQRDLERSKLSDTLENKLKQRPDAQTLVNDRILEYPPAGTSTSPKEELERMLAHRPDRDELVGRNILPSSNVAPALMAAQKELERNQLENALENKLKQRPDAQTLVKEGILPVDEAPPS